MKQIKTVFIYVLKWLTCFMYMAFLTYPEIINVNDNHDTNYMQKIYAIDLYTYII